MKGCRERERERERIRNIDSFRPLPLMKGCRERERDPRQGVYNEQKRRERKKRKKRRKNQMINANLWIVSEPRSPGLARKTNVISLYL